MTLEQSVLAVVAKSVKTAPENIPLDADLRDRFGLDSLQGLELMAALEKKFGVLMHDDDLDSYRTVRDIVGVIERSVAQAASA
jgi:acyl carrier protein